MSEESNVNSHLSKLVGPLDYTTPVPELMARIERQGRFITRRLILELEYLTSMPMALQTEESRVLIARVLAALFPESLDLIKSYLHTTDLSEQDAEMQFSIFVALSELPALVGNSEALSEITDVLQKYLLAIDTSTSQAAWMAGDLLGDHWPLPLALPVLFSVVHAAEHVAGRQGAIHGLSHALLRTTKKDQWKIIEALKNVAANDPDYNVRRSAEIAATSRGH